MASLFTSRLRCNGCNSRSPFSKGTREFECAHCGTFNFFDMRGGVVDPPTAAVTSTPAARPLTTTAPLPETLDHQRQQPFCRTCVQNQHLYNETLGNYLPDESHPQYKQYEKAIPTYKKELEKRYPLVCKKCAPMAQSKIERSDYYGLTQNAARLTKETRARGGQPAYRIRDSSGKKMMRIFYNLIWFALSLGMVMQVAFHAYAILAIVFGTAYSEPDVTDMTDTVYPSLNDCANLSLSLHFSTTCLHIFSDLIPYTLALATCGLWYNTGLKDWYHHTRRIEAINGQSSYFYMQVTILFVRSWAWFNLSNPITTAELTNDQLIAVHGFVIFFMITVQMVAQRGIQSVRWTMKGTIMPKPSELDVLGANAGPSAEHFTPKASEKDPFRYLRKNEPGPLEVINSVTKKRQQQKQPIYTKSSHFSAQQPSPDYSDNEDAMELDDPTMYSSQRVAHPRPRLEPRNVYMNHTNAPALSFGGAMSNEVYNMQTQLRAEDERMRIQQEQQMQQKPNQFYTRIPQAPMSMERRLRNPVIPPPEPEEIPLSEQPDFWLKMRQGVKPAQFPERGTNFQPKQSTWNLPSDSKTLGLEDRFFKDFSLNEPVPAVPNENSSNQRGAFFGGFFGR